MYTFISTIQFVPPQLCLILLPNTRISFSTTKEKKKSLIAFSRTILHFFFPLLAKGRGSRVLEKEHTLSHLALFKLKFLMQMSVPPASPFHVIVNISVFLFPFNGCKRLSEPSGYIPFKDTQSSPLTTLSYLPDTVNSLTTSSCFEIKLFTQTH